MKHRERHITSLIFILLLVTINAVHILIELDNQRITPQSAFNAAFCHQTDWHREPPAKRQLCGVGIFLNSDSEDALRYLPAIGPQRAKDIVAYRTMHGPFKNITDLLNIEGIGPVTVQKIQPWIEDLKRPIEKSGKNESR